MIIFSITSLRITHHNINTNFSSKYGKCFWRERLKTGQTLIGSCCTAAIVKHETALKIKIRTPTRNFRHPFWCNSQPCTTVPWKWRMLIWKGCNGFFFSTLRRLSIYVPPVSLTEATLSRLQSIHHHGELADFMSASSAGADRCDDVGRGPHGRQVWGQDGDIAFNLLTQGQIDLCSIASERGVFWTQ